MHVSPRVSTRACVYMCPAEASNPSGGHCCQTYWGLFLRQPEGGGGGGGGGGDGGRRDGGRWSGGCFEGGGPRGGGGGWLALLICKTANLRTLCLPALLFSFSTFSTTAFSSYGGPTRSFSPFPYRSFSLTLSLSLSSSLSHPLFRLISSFSRARFSTLANTHTNPDCHSLALSSFPSVSLVCVPSSLRYVP